MAQKANEFGDVKALGGALLSALEKRDAEALSLLRSTHEVGLLEHVRGVKEKAIDEAKIAIEALQESRQVTSSFRQEYFASRPRTISKEDEQRERLEFARDAQIASQVIEVIRGVMAALPNFDIGLAGVASSPVVKASWGGANLAAIFDAASRGASLAATVYNYQANKASIVAGYDRRLV